MQNVTAIILGGGRGTRLYPLTLERAKPAVGFAGKYRLIDIPLSNCINSGVKRIYVLTQFMTASLHRHIMQTYQFDVFTDGFVDILAAEQTPHRSDWYQGTADAVRATLGHTTYYRSDQMVVLSGDHLYRMDYADLVRHHRETAADVTIGVYPVTRAEAPRMGLLKADERGIVEEFVEKPQEEAVIDRFRAPERLVKGAVASGGEAPAREERFLASMGIYVFEPDVLREMLADPGPTDFGKEIIPSGIGKYRVVAYPFFGYWRDIGTIEAFFEANIELARPEPPFRLYEPGGAIYTRTRSLPPSRVIRSEIRDSLLVEGSDITGARISDSIIGMRSVVREDSRIDRVVMLGADHYQGFPYIDDEEDPGADLPPLGIGRNCTIERAIIDKNVRIGDGVVIRSKEGAADVEGDTYWVRDGVTIIPKGTVIPAVTVI
jgi:glucose-1-phosphate adenylyltransferase